MLSVAVDVARSGNRGECSQPCRLSYDLEDAAGRRILRGKHLLSVRDLNLADRLGALIDAGVTSFKIEGRLKDEGYIRNVVAYYRRRLDEAIASRGDCRRASVGETRLDFTPIRRRVSRAANRSISLWGGRRVSRRSTRPSRWASS
ncbi:MAG: peptidase U32 family protein [Alistipes communis]